MACLKCKWQGFILTHMLRNGKSKTLVMQCNWCRDVKRYDEELARRRKLYAEGEAVMTNYEQQTGKDLNKLGVGFTVGSVGPRMKLVKGHGEDEEESGG